MVRISKIMLGKSHSMPQSQALIVLPVDQAISPEKMVQPVEADTLVSRWSLTAMEVTQHEWKRRSVATTKSITTPWCSEVASGVYSP